MKLKFWAMFDIDGAFTHVANESIKFIEESKKIASAKLASNIITSQFYSMEQKMNSRNDLFKSVKRINDNQAASGQYIKDLYSVND